MAVYTVKIDRHGTDLGFSVKGGSEHGIGIIVSDVDARGIAHDRLAAGDEILYVNGRRLQDVTHGEAVQLIRSAGANLELTVQHHASLQSALATSSKDYEKMNSEFERMREKIRGRPHAPAQAMQGAPAAKPFPFPPFLTSRWTSSRSDANTICSPTEDIECASEARASNGGGSEHHNSNSVLPNLHSAESDDGISVEHPDGLKPREESEQQPTKAVDVRRGSLPEGWSQRLDPRTRQFFYENQWLGLSFWSDPRTLPQVANLREYKWSDLPVGWHRCVDKNGFVYFLNHHNHTTHWESPSLLRQKKLLVDVKTHYKEVDERLQAEAKTLQTKRDALLKNRDELQRLSQQRDSLQARDSAAMAAQPRFNDAGSTSPNHELKNSLDGLLSAIVEEVMQLNESVESLSSQIGIYQKGLSSLEVLRRKAQGELISGNDLSEDSGKLAFQLFDVYMNCISLYRQKVMAVHRLEERRKRQRRRSSVLAGPGSLNASLSSPEHDASFHDGECMSPDTSLLYMMQLPNTKARRTREHSLGDDDDCDSNDDIDGDDENDIAVSMNADAREQQTACRLHVLPDQLTVKCNLEMRVDMALLQRLSALSQGNLSMLQSWEEDVRRSSQAWPSVVEKLTGLEDLFEATHFDWLRLPFKEKLKKMTNV